MPITLKQASRRKFIARTGLAALACLTKWPLQASTISVDRHYWALFSDTHIAANRAEIHSGVNMSSHLDAAVGEVLGMQGARPSGLLINGDCAFQTGEEADYAAFIERIQPLREAAIPIHITLGNHDERGHFSAALGCNKEVGKFVPEHLVSRVKSARANWFLLDSLDKATSPPGKIGQSQLDWLAHSLDKVKGLPAIVVVHHNPVFAEGKNSGLLDTTELMKVIRPRRQVKALVFGHTHTWKTVVDESGLHLINLPPVAYPFQPDQPSGWVRAMLRKDGVELELRSLNPAHPAHGQKIALEWRA